ncbi:hypothetical protein HHK36_022776 [Tetracentron sinense]|uniref:Synergin gamma C-terminal domain-containing protein n=1 Tax=Tetracentron sinense TaxID=13715 RepID=A0A835D9Y3_TETSI|nr:hypothetical protein HHK36_022776 [Tetracentron sinense]
MAEKQAEDDDDEGFGDFVFAPHMNIHSIYKHREDDDDWGLFMGNFNHKRDFLEHPLRSELSNGFGHPQNPTNPSEIPPNSDLFGFFSDHSMKPLESQQVRVESEKNLASLDLENRWEKPRGALPLSIFGDEEEDSDSVNLSFDDAKDMFSPKPASTVKNGLNFGSGVGLNDIIGNLYSQAEEIKIGNGSNSNLIEGNEDFDDDGWDFKNADSDPEIKDQKVSDLLEVKVEAKAINHEIQIKFENGLNPSLVNGSENFDDDEWDFKDAFSETTGPDSYSGIKEQEVSHLSGVKVETTTTDRDIQVEGKGWENSGGAITTSGFSNGGHDPIDLFVVPDGFSYKPSESSVVTQKVFFSDPYIKTKQMETESGLDSYPVDRNVDSDENFWEFKDALSETEAVNYSSGQKEEQKVVDLSGAGVEVLTFDGDIQGNGKMFENHQGGLPLSIFGNGKLESDDSLNGQDVFSYKATYTSNGINRQEFRPIISFNDLISNLYSQAEQIPGVDSTRKPTENELGLAQTGLDSNSVNGEDDFDGNSWEFKDAFMETRDEGQTSVFGLGDNHPKIPTESKLKNFVDFYCRLKDESCFVVLFHLDCLKVGAIHCYVLYLRVISIKFVKYDCCQKAQKVAALSGEDVKAVALLAEIQEALKELHQENVIAEEVYSEDHPPRKTCLDELLEVMHEPKFQVLESEFHLSKRISLAEKDISSAIWLFKHAVSIRKTLELGSMEEQYNYVTTWSKMISACAQELKHGAFIWKQSIQKNVQRKILSEPQGQRYILALGEIYRVVGVLRVSATLYKPWILSSLEDLGDLSGLLEECTALWSDLGLEEALRSIDGSVGSLYDGTIKALLESIKSVHDLNELAFQNHVFPQQEPICRLSLLSLGMVPAAGAAAIVSSYLQSRCKQLEGGTERQAVAEALRIALQLVRFHQWEMVIIELMQKHS